MSASPRAARPAPKAAPVRRPRVHRELVAGLAKQILSGDLVPGTPLPEADLCAHFNVSRTAMREAVKVLESKGLVQTRMRLGNQVQERESWNMLDPDVLAWTEPAQFDARFVESLMEARKLLEPAAAEMAATRATAKDLAALEDAYLRMAASLPHAVDECCDADLDFHSTLLIASHNLVFAQFAGTIRAALRVLFEITLHLGTSHQRALHMHGKVVEAIRLRDPAAARKASETLLASTAHDLGAGTKRA